MTGTKPVEFIFDNYTGCVWDRNKKNGWTNGWTLVLTFSRPWCIEPFFRNFETLEMDMERCHLLIVDNTVLPMVSEMLKKKIDMMKDCFRTIRLIKTWEPMGGPIRPRPRETVETSAAKHVYNMHCEFIKHVHTRKFVIMEDDTLAPVQAIPRMLKKLKLDKSIGIVTGVEPTRSTERHVPLRLGVHFVKADGMRLKERLSLPNTIKSSVDVDACGWYCLASYTELWRESLNGLDEYFSVIPHFACDTMHTYQIKKLGWRIVADFKINCIHMASDTKHIFFCRTDRAIPMVDVYIPQYDIYMAGHLVEWDDLLRAHWNI